METYLSVKIKKIVKENYFVKSFVLNAKLEAQPGQFVMVWLPRINEKPFSLSQTNPVTLTVARVGPFTQKLHQLKVGDQISLRGPYGKGFKKQKGKVLIAAGGYGAVPLYWLSQSLSFKKRIKVIIGAKSKKDLFFQKKFKRLGVDLKICTDDGSCGFKGFTTDLAEKILKTDSVKQIYSCGPKPMMEKIALLAYKNNIPCQLSLENYMKCGIGLCGACACGKIRLCKDGPVVSARKYLLNNDKLKQL